MRAQTRELLDRLAHREWFSLIGKERLSPEIGRVRTWDEAIDACSDDDYENVGIAASNLLRQQLDSNAPAIYERWNDYVRMLKGNVEELVSEKLAFWNGLIKGLESVEDQARWDVLTAALEVEFSEHVRTSFYRDLITWYERGHFPCGWSGALDSGNPIVF